MDWVRLSKSGKDLTGNRSYCLQPSFSMNLFKNVGMFGAILSLMLSSYFQLNFSYKAPSKTIGPYLLRKNLPVPLRKTSLFSEN